MTDYDNIYSVQATLQDLIDTVNEGHVTGIVYQILLDDERYMVGWNNSISYIERMGLVEAVKHDMMLKANNIEPNLEEE